MSYKPREEMKSYMLCSEDHFIWVNEKAERLFLSNYTSRYSTYSLSIKDNDLQYAIGSLNYKRFYSELESFSKDTRYDVASRLEMLTRDFVLGNKCENLGDKDSNSYFSVRPFGRNTEFRLFEFALRVFSSSVNGAERAYWRNFCSFFANTNLLSASAYETIKDYVLSLSDQFFSEYVNEICGDDPAFRSSLSAISIFKKFSVHESANFRFKLNRIIWTMGKKAFEIYGEDFIKAKSWNFDEVCLPALEYILSDISVASEDVLNSIDTSFLSYASQDSFAYTAYYFKIIDKIPEKSFSDDIFKATDKKDAAQRAAMYSSYISNGMGDKKFFRKMRSESSVFCSCYALRTLIENRELYADDYLEYISQFNDSKHSAVVKILEYGSPKENLMGLLGNDLADKEVVFERLNK